MSKVNLEDFFEFGVNNPINRLAYTDADIEYKVKIIKKMQELGMDISIDNVGNICGTMKLGNGNGRALAIGSHTDSVYNGGQYDGQVGVIKGLANAEKLAEHPNGLNGTYNVVKAGLS